LCELDALCVLCALGGERPILTRAEYNSNS